jgi:hypothetical protein
VTEISHSPSMEMSSYFSVSQREADDEQLRFSHNIVGVQSPINVSQGHYSAPY